MLATSSGHNAVAKLLINAGASMNIRSARDNKTFFDLVKQTRIKPNAKDFITATIQNRKNIVTAQIADATNLAEDPASIIEDYLNPIEFSEMLPDHLEDAIEQGDWLPLRIYLHGNGNILATNAQGDTMIELAVMHGQYEIVQNLLRALKLQNKTIDYKNLMAITVRSRKKVETIQKPIGLKMKQELNGEGLNELASRHQTHEALVQEYNKIEELLIAKCKEIEQAALDAARSNAILAGVAAAARSAIE
jgi:ankyrin repeat protein